MERVAADEREQVVEGEGEGGSRYEISHAKAASFFPSAASWSFRTRVSVFQFFHGWW